jgi:hypothetical protein
MIAAYCDDDPRRAITTHVRLRGCTCQPLPPITFGEAEEDGTIPVTSPHYDGCPALEDYKARHMG